MPLHVDASLPEPPYAQLREQVREQAESGELAVGARLPTVRALAGELGLAPGTVARAYRELEALGVIETRGRSGSFVGGDAVRQEAGAAADAFARRMRELGIGTDDALALVRRSLG